MVAPGCARPNTPRSDPKDMSQLAEPLRSRLATMMADLGGLVLVSGYRDAGRQWDLRRERCPGRECSRSCKGYPTTALPGSSNHQRRTAADIGGRNLAAANRVKASYGLHTPVPGEAWHFEAHGTPTRKIRPYGGTPPQPQPAPHEGFLMALTDQQQQELYDRVMAIDLRTVAIHHETTDGANPNLTGISSRQIASLTRLEKAVAAVQVTIAALKPR